MDTYLIQLLDKDIIIGLAIKSGMSESVFVPIIDDYHGWFAVMLNDSAIGIIRVEQMNNSSLCIHPYLMNDKKRHCRDMIRSLYRWMLSTPEQINKLVCFIPDCYTKTINFAKKTGFVEEGRLKRAFFMNDDFCDVAVLGITKPEIEVYL